MRPAAPGTKDKAAIGSKSEVTEDEVAELKVLQAQ